jgi:hypothetical protein
MTVVSLVPHTDCIKPSLCNSVVVNDRVLVNKNTESLTCANK